MPELTSRLLVGVDTPPDSHHVVRVAARLAVLLGADLHLAHVRLTRSTMQGRPMTPAQRETQQHDGEALLEALAGEAVDVGAAVAGRHVRFGERIERELAMLQDELDAGLLVLGASRGGGVARRLLSSPVSGTVRRAPGSVLVVRPPAEQQGDLL